MPYYLNVKKMSISGKATVQGRTPAVVKDLRWITAGPYRRELSRPTGAV